MKALYEITDRRGIHLCYQVAHSEKEAVKTAKMYGFRSAAHATFVRED